MIIHFMVILKNIFIRTVRYKREKANEMRVSSSRGLFLFDKVI